MQYLRKNPVIFYLSLVILIALPLLLLPINLFPGEIIFKRGLVEISEQRPLSLSYFLGFGYDKKDMTDIKDFYLLTEGYILAGILILGFPALAVYRLKLRA